MHTVETAHRQSVGRDYLQDKTKKKERKGLWVVGICGWWWVQVWWVVGKSRKKRGQ